MALKTDTIQLDELTADPPTPVDGEVWYDGTAERLKLRRNGATEILIDQDEFTGHTGNTSNPHAVTLEQARTGGNTIAGDIDANNAGTIKNLPDPTANGDAANKGWTNSQIQSYLQGLDWQESVISRYDPTTSTPPGPSTSDRYISTATANGWTIHYIYESDGATWTETIPNEGFVTRVEDEDKVYIFDGATWGLWDATIDHGNLQGLTDDDHDQYLLVNGTRAMSGGLDMGTNAITNVGNVDGVDVSDHSARHDPGGADALTTGAPGAIQPDDSAAEGVAVSFARSDHTHGIVAAAPGTIQPDDAAAEGSATSFARSDHRHAIGAAAPSQGVGGGNSEGVATSFARSDHDHTIRETGGPANLTVGIVADGQFLKRSGTALVGSAPGFLNTKTGRALAAGFAGNPKTQAVTFTAVFPDTNYNVTLGVEGTSSYSPRVESKTAAGFTINLGSNVVLGLTSVGWQAIADGESS